MKKFICVFLTVILCVASISAAFPVAFAEDIPQEDVQPDPVEEYTEPEPVVQEVVSEEIYAEPVYEEPAVEETYEEPVTEYSEEPAEPEVQEELAAEQENEDLEEPEENEQEENMPEEVFVPAPRPEPIVKIRSEYQLPVREGDTVRIVSELINADETNVERYQWQVDKGFGFEDIPGANESFYEFRLTTENVHYLYRVQVDIVR